MAEFTDRIKLIYDVVTDNATASTGKLKQSMGEAEGAFGKVKAAGSSLFDTVGQNATAAFAGAGAAIGAFVIQGVNAFVDLAKSAKDFSTAAGTSVEDASRWIETADDLGVQADAVSGAMARLNREAAAGKLRDFGITTDDANERLVQTLEKLAAIPNAADRAKAQFELLGKGGAALAPLLANVDTLRERLADVKGGKLIDDADVAKGQQLADNMDALSDAWSSLQLSVGGTIAPLISLLADFANTVATFVTEDNAKQAEGFWDSMANGARAVGRSLITTLPAIGALAEATGLVGDESQSAAKGTDAMAKSMADARDKTAAEADAIDEANQALQDWTNATLAAFNSQLGLASAANRADDAFGKYAAAAATAEAAAWGNRDANDAAADAQRDAEQAALAQASAAVKLAQDQATANGETLTAAQVNTILVGQLRTMAATLDPGSPLRRSLEGYAAQLEAVPDRVSTTVDIVGEEEALRKLRELYNWIQQVGGGVDIPIGFPGVNATAAPAPAANVVPISAARSAPAVLGASRPTILVQNVSYSVPIQAGPIVGNQAELGRLVADALVAHERRIGAARRFV